jgi:hypothetical protein
MLAPTHAQIRPNQPTCMHSVRTFTRPLAASKGARTCLPHVKMLLQDSDICIVDPIGAMPGAGAAFGPTRRFDAASVPMPAMQASAAGRDLHQQQAGIVCWSARLTPAGSSPAGRKTAGTAQRRMKLRLPAPAQRWTRTICYGNASFMA